MVVKKLNSGIQIVLEDYDIMLVDTWVAGLWK